MNPPVFTILDVFATRRYSGNQLAVFRGAGHLGNEEMQALAREMNYSETTFILTEEERRGGYDVRIFTPEKELPFAGHPTLGTAFVIQQEIIGRPVDRVVLNLGVGQIPVSFQYRKEIPDLLWMQQKNPRFGHEIPAREVAEILGLDYSDLDSRFPVQEVSTGLPCIIVPLRSLAAVNKASVHREKFFDLIENRQAKSMLIFCPETLHEENDLHVRFFADFYGVPEDPATGSANGCLAGYLAKHRFWGTPEVDVSVEQGYRIGRPSLLFLRAEDRGPTIDVFVGGKVVSVARGELV